MVFFPQGLGLESFADTLLFSWSHTISLRREPYPKCVYTLIRTGMILESIDRYNNVTHSFYLCSRLVVGRTCTFLNSFWIGDVICSVHEPISFSISSHFFHNFFLLFFSASFLSNAKIRWKSTVKIQFKFGDT